mgnify:CR=1 FL=1
MERGLKTDIRIGARAYLSPGAAFADAVAAFRQVIERTQTTPTIRSARLPRRTAAKQPSGMPSSQYASRNSVHVVRNTTENGSISDTSSGSVAASNVVCQAISAGESAACVAAFYAAITGGRILATLAKIIDENRGGRGLVSICAAGGLGITAIVER